MQTSRKRGQLIPKGDGRWLLRMYLGTDPKGKRRYSSRMFEGTTSQAQRELTAMQREVDTQSFVEPSKQTLADFLKDWLKSKVDVAARTLADYTSRLETDVVPILGAYKLHEIDGRAVQSLIQVLAAKGYSPRTVEYTYRVLHAAFEQAVAWNLLVRNPSHSVKLPKKIKRAPSVLSMKQVALLLETAKNDPLLPLWMLLLTSGLRPQEALALQWGDLDLDGCWLSVQRVIVDDGNGAISLSEGGKTDGSVRRIGLAKTTVAALRTHLTRQKAETLLAGPAYVRLGLVFATPKGHLLDPSKVRRRWKASLKAAKLPAVRLYDTRHTHATALLAAGADLGWVSDRLGHTDIKMTKQHYAHVLPETHREMGEMTDRMLKEAAK